MDTYITYLSEYWPLIVLAGASTVLAAFFAASETAIVFSNKTRLHKLAEAGNMRAKTVLRLTTGRDRLHSALLVAENFFIVLAVTLCAVVTGHVFPGTPLAVTTVFMSIVVVLFAKLAPKGVAFRNPDRLAL